jgi:chromosome segregation ATPase
LVRAETELEEKEVVIQELTSALADLHVVAAQRQELLHQNHVAFADVWAHLESKDDEIARQHEAIQGLQAGIRNLHHAAEDLRSAASERMLVIERLDAEIQALRTALAASQDECAARLDVIERLDAEVRRLQAAAEATDASETSR